MFARTDRLLLRPSWPEDAGALYDAIADEAVVCNLARAPWPYTRDEAIRFASSENPQMFPNFMLMLRTDAAPQLIGACGLGERDGDAELGYWIARPFWGQGFAAEAARAVVGIARALGHKKLVAGHFADNPASGRVLRKVGFQPLGRIEQRYSAGRGQNVAAALYELPISADATDGPVSPDASFTRMRALYPMKQAA